jgi:hypothetical protein
MFRSRRELWRAVATDPALDASVVREAGLSARWCDRLARLSDSRARVRDDARGRARRLAQLVRLALFGGYLPRTMAGLGLRALAADTLSLLRSRSAAVGAGAPDELARRVAADRAAGRTPEAIIAELTARGTAPLYGQRWTAEMIRDLVFQARRSTEAEEVAAAGSPRVYAPPDKPPR